MASTRSGRSALVIKGDLLDQILSPEILQVFFEQHGLQAMLKEQLDKQLPELVKQIKDRFKQVDRIDGLNDYLKTKVQEFVKAAVDAYMIAHISAIQVAVETAVAAKLETAIAEAVRAAVRKTSDRIVQAAISGSS